MTKKNKKASANYSGDPLFFKEKDPGFVRKIFVYTTLALLWLVTIFGLLFLPVVFQLASPHSYFGDRISGEFWAYLYIVIALYTLLATVYIGFGGFNARYTWVGIINSLMLSVFFMSTFVSFFLLFYTR